MQCVPCVSSMSRLLAFTKLHFLSYRLSCVVVTVSNTVLLILCFLPPFPSPPLLYPPHTQWVCVYLCAFCLLASVSPCWQRAITAPGIKSSSQAFGWRSTSQMKRMLVHLKVAAGVACGCVCSNIILADEDSHNMSVASVFCFFLILPSLQFTLLDCVQVFSFKD